MKMRDLWNATNYYFFFLLHNLRDVDALFTKCYGTQKQKQQQVTNAFGIYIS